MPLCKQEYIHKILELCERIFAMCVSVSLCMCMWAEGWCARGWNPKILRLKICTQFCFLLYKVPMCTRWLDYIALIHADLWRYIDVNTTLPRISPQIIGAPMSGSVEYRLNDVCTKKSLYYHRYLTTVQCALLSVSITETSYRLFIASENSDQMAWMSKLS